ncbi:hypothetical protein CTI12_AA244130 [Artemisia annua]|uniref:Helitron helicase-like domain-containing protein n=1 Tax=Artemisia annua TaxID=35608 RepID=A0A2U1NNH8_ARTAN|nr:hypothetical protein CTI12_AA244130 [Artemisia annua]
MKTKRKATRRVTSVASLEPANLSHLAQQEEPYGVDLEPKRLLPNVDALGTSSDSVTTNPCGSRHAASDICTGTSSIQHNRPTKRAKCNTLAANVRGVTADAMPKHTISAISKECDNFVVTNESQIIECTSPAIVSLTTEKRFTTCATDDVLSNVHACITNECSVGQPQNINEVPLDVHPTSHPHATTFVDKGKRKVYELPDTEQAFTDDRSEDFSVMDDNRQTVMNQQLARDTGRSPLRSNVDTAGPSSTERPRTCRRLTGSENVNHQTSNQHQQSQGPPSTYIHMGQCNQICHHCKARFWYDERSSGHGLRADIVEDLVALLDDHNELVQLFRTARDKMSQTNIPQFKVRLFGVVGSRQHELPTGDSIGAIVFEGGPDVQTDFDVVVEQHDHRLKQVNKLNASYMSLQFPLVFIFGEDGYHLGRRLLSKNSSDDPPKKMTMQKQMEETSSIVASAESKGKEIVTQLEEVTLANINETDIGKAICVKVYRKWTPTNRQAKPVICCFMLIDRHV